MKITQEVRELFCASQTQKALATTGSKGLNVVPVSTIRIEDDSIWLIDYFFGKTRVNIQETSQATLVGWCGFEGYQIRADVEYVQSGIDFEKAKEWIAKLHPTRTVNALVKLIPVQIDSVSIADKI